MIDPVRYRAAFPRLYDVRYIDMVESIERGLPRGKSYFLFMQPFEFVSSIWGSILVPEGFVTDFASVPQALQSWYPADDPILLPGSAPHDLLFTPRADGTRGWLPDGRRLALYQVNRVLIEAMEVCDASWEDRTKVLIALTLGNQHIKHEFAPE